MKEKDSRFEFGKNWKDYVRHNYSEENLQISKDHILEFLKLENLDGKSILDIGCGSGLHSLAALRAGAESVFSFDYDKHSVDACKYLMKYAGNYENWRIEHGSVLDDNYINNLQTFDIVYSWGVLHHTGDVWHAITNAASRVKSGGFFYIALYSADVQIDPPPKFWLDIKRRYVSSGFITRRYLECWYIWNFIMNGEIKNYRNFLDRKRDYKKARGMNIMTDIRDWLGGWPMEFVFDDEAVRFCEKLGFSLVDIRTGEANTEFLFINNGK